MRDAAAAGAADLAGREVDDVEQARDLEREVADGGVLVGRLAGLDEPEVVGEQARVEHVEQTVLVADLPDRVHVRERDRLTADQVRARLDAHEGDLVGAVLRDEGLELGGVQVALERVLARGLQGDVAVDLLDACRR